MNAEKLFLTINTVDFQSKSHLFHRSDCSPHRCGCRDLHNRNSESSPSSNPAPQTELSPAVSLKAVCDTMRYPNSCFSSISLPPESNTTDTELFFKLSLRVAIDEPSFAPMRSTTCVCRWRLTSAAISALGTVTERIASSANVSHKET